jgi:ATP-binding cassette subfamily B protein
MFKPNLTFSHFVRFGGVRRKRVPVVRQLGGTECGAATLAMILGYYGRETTVSECHKYFSIGRDGLKASMIAEAASAFGLNVRAFTVEPPALELIRLPAIGHWQFNHFVVIETWSPRKVEIVDPAVGRRTLSALEFSRNFTGVILTFEPGASFHKRKLHRRSLLFEYLVMILQSEKAVFSLVQILAASLLIQMLALVLPIFTKILFDDVLGAKNVSLLRTLVIATCLYLLAGALLKLLRDTILLYLRARVDVKFMANFFRHLTSLPFSFFQQRTSGDLLSRIQSTAIIHEVVVNRFVSILIDSGLMLFFVGLLMSTYPRFGILILFLGVIQFGGPLMVGPRLNELVHEELRARSEQLGYSVEAVSGIAIVKASGLEDSVTDHWLRLLVCESNWMTKRGLLAQNLSGLIGLLGQLTPVLIMAVGAAKVLNGAISLGTLLGINIVASFVLSPIGSLVETTQQIQSVAAHLERIADVNKQEPEHSGRGERKALNLTGQFSVQDVSFRYSSSSAWVLRNVSFSVNAGETVAIVGRTGSGKSTLALLILSLYDVTAGNILFDGLPLGAIDVKYLRKQFGVVLQDAVYFTGSIRRNIALLSPKLPLNEVINAAKIACLHDDVEEMPLRYDTKLMVGTMSLSGGQLQRLAIARAIAARPALLILDEATSNLDTITEQRIHSSLAKLPCTKIVIAHRMSTVRDADKIIVLDQGRVVEEGTHEQLMKQGRHYVSLVRGQSLRDISTWS